MRLTTSFAPDTDFTRDLYRVYQISQGKLSLIGPPLTVGLFSGPYYHYLFVPALVLSRLSENSFLFFNSFLFALALGIGYLITKSKLIPLAVGLSPFYLLSARHPGNGFTYLPILLLIILVILAKNTFSRLNLLVLGVLVGICANMHPISLTALAPILMFLYFKIAHKKSLFYLALTAMLTCAPLALFELKNHFLLINESSQINIPTSLNLIMGQISQYLGIGAIWISLACVFLAFVLKNNASKLLAVLSLSSLWIVIVVLTRKYEPHYLLPVLTLLLTSLVWLLNKSRMALAILLLIIFALISFPKKIYTPAGKSLAYYQSSANFILSQQLILPGELFNLVHIQDAKHAVVAGDIYRFMLSKNSFRPQQVTQYSHIHKLLIISELPTLIPDNLRIWEVSEFAGENLVSLPEKLSFGNTSFYVLSKK